LPMKVRSEFSIGFDRQQHMSLSNFTLEKQEEYFSFAFVRNPWDRIMSSYLYSKRLGYKFTFKSFLDSIDFANHCKPQSFFINENIDFIGRFENLQEGFNEVCEKLGFDAKQLPHENKTTHEHYTEWYTDENRKLIQDRYSEDIDTFNYKFGD
jgi:chondroitin 4-sulfotransferase 11